MFLFLHLCVCPRQFDLCFVFVFAPDCVTYVSVSVFVCSPQSVLLMYLFLCLCVSPCLCGLCGPGVEFLFLCLCVCPNAPICGLCGPCGPCGPGVEFLFLYLCVYPSLCGLCGPGVELPLQQLREVARPSGELGHHQRELVTTTK